MRFILPGTRCWKDVATRRLAVLGCEVVVEGVKERGLECQRSADLFSGCDSRQGALVGPPLCVARDSQILPSSFDLAESESLRLPVTLDLHPSLDNTL